MKGNKSEYCDINYTLLVEKKNSFRSLEPLTGGPV